MDILKILTKNGLSEKEAQVYLSLLKLHEALPSSIARQSKVKRATTYVILEELQKKGLVTHFKRKNRLHYRALNPHFLVEEKYQNYLALEKSLPELTKLHELYNATPQMSVYEGKKGIIQIMENTLTTSNKELLCWSNIDHAMDPLRDYYPTYIRKKNKLSIWVRCVLNYGKEGLRFKRYAEKELRECYLIPEEKFPFNNEINIYDDKVAIISHKDKVGVIIQNQYIADTQKSIFKMGFEYAKLLEQQLLTEKDQEYINTPVKKQCDDL
jgi:sugar-specific transcriptional regulator TrmB